MSDLRVALVAEGPTDAVVIEAALKALLHRSFVLTQLQPELTRPRMGAGWGGVLRWCHDFAERGFARFEDDPTLPGFDLFVVHVDADVHERAYADVSQDVARTARARSWPELPSDVPCPPATNGAEVIRRCVLSWAGLPERGPRTVLCVPSKAIDAWLVAAAFEEGHALLTGLECNRTIESRLAALPVGQRIKKTRPSYLEHQKAVTAAWPVVRARCTEADRFSAEVAAVAL